MTVQEATKCARALSRRHAAEIGAKFSPEVACAMLDCLSAAMDATRYQLAERKDSRDVIITLSRMFVEADNASEVLSRATTDTILSKGKK